MTRDDLAKMFTGTGAELGVAAGDFSAAILTNPRVSRLWSVDRWSDHHDEAEYRHASERLAAFGPRSFVIRSTFAEALPLFADNSLDFLYIDGYAHTGQDDGRTLADWWPKVRQGGVFAGHDYHPAWQPTIDAVDRFAALHGLSIGTTDEPEYPSWWVVKR